MTYIDGFDFIGFIMIFNREDKINNQKFYILGHDLLISLFLFSFFIDVLVLLSVDYKYEQVYISSQWIWIFFIVTVSYAIYMVA